MNSALPVRSRKLVAGVKCHTQGRGVGLDFNLRRHIVSRVPPCTELRVQDIARMDVRIAVMRAGFGHAIDLLGRLVIPQPIPAVVGEPEFAGVRMPVHTDGIAHTGCVHGCLTGCRVHAQDAGETRVLGFADVAGSAHRERTGSRRGRRTGTSSRDGARPAECRLLFQVQGCP